MNDPMYSPTEEEIADRTRAIRRKFSNRFVPMNTYHDAMLRIEELEKQLKAVLDRETALTFQRDELKDNYDTLLEDAVEMRKKVEKLSSPVSNEEMNLANWKGLNNLRPDEIIQSFHRNRIKAVTQ